LRLGFKAEERTQVWRDNSLANGAADRLSPEKQGKELCAVMREDNPGRVLKALSEQGLLGGLDRKLAAGRLPYDQFARIRSVGQSVPGAETFLLNFHCLVSKLGGGQRKRLAAKIIPDRKEAKTALGMELAARKLARALTSSRAGQPSQVFALLEGQPRYLLLFLLANFPQAKMQNRVKNFLFKFPTVRARMPRAELATLGLEPGPKFEKILHQLFLAQLDGRIKSHPQLLKEFRSLAGIKEPPKPPKPVEPKPEPRHAPPKPEAKHPPAKPARSPEPAKAGPAKPSGKHVKSAAQPHKPAKKPPKAPPKKTKKR
ncbi:MAG: hypothetical protein L0209_12440, partial [candidate division Zixibacteria bacterium]|nr:hypothetical protein [candidate division Zixibacteria bacterium]